MWYLDNKTNSLTHGVCRLQFEETLRAWLAGQRVVACTAMFPAISKTIAGLMPDLANAFTVLGGVGVVGARRAIYARPVATGINHDVRVFATDLTTSSFTDGSRSWGHVSNGGDVQTRDTHTPPAGQVWQRDVPLATWPLGHCAQ